MDKERRFKNISSGEHNFVAFPAGGGTLFQPDLDELGNALKKSGKVEKISLPNIIMGSCDYTIFAEGIAHSPHLRILDLRQDRISPDAARLLADSLRNHTELQEVLLSGCDLEPESSAILLEALSTCPNLREVVFSDNPLDTQGAEATAAMMRNAHRLQSLKMRNCELADADIRTIAKALPHCRRMVELDCGQNTTEIGANIIGKVLDQGMNRDLIEYYPYNVASDKNRRQNRLDVQDELIKPLADCHGDFDRITTAKLGEAYDRLPVITRLDSNLSGILQPLQAYIANLPRVDDRENITLADLLAEDEHQRSALSNPLTWQNLPQVLGKLETSGEQLTLDILMQKNRDGMPHLAAALATAPDTVIRALNNHGVQITADTLLNGREPNFTMQAIIDRGMGSDLISVANWQGQPRNDFTAVYRALPEQQQAYASNYHAVLASLDTPAQKGLAR